MCCSAEEIAWLREQPQLSQTPEYFFETLRGLHFPGDIGALPEGSVALPGTPVMRITAPLLEASLLETRLLQAVTHASRMATHAAQPCADAGTMPLWDLSCHAWQSPQTAWATARATWIGGFEGTSNTQAACMLGVPTSSLASPSLLSAYPDPAVVYAVLNLHTSDKIWISLTTPDTIARLKPLRGKLHGVHLASPDLHQDFRALRGMLARHGMGSTPILCSNLRDRAQLRALASSGDASAVGVEEDLLQGIPPLPLRYRMAEMFRGAESTRIYGPHAAAHPGQKQTVRSQVGDGLRRGR